MIELDFLEELDRFNLALKKNSTEIMEGEQKSDSSGEGLVFQDHKKYVPGDDIRRIDWKAYARTEEFYVKRFEEERSITVHILVDRSSSMDFGNVNKYEYAAKLGLSLAYITTNTNDRFRFSVFSETVTDITHARRNANMPEIVKILNNLQHTPESKFERCLSQYSSRIENKSILVVISDFLSDVEDIRKGIERFENTDLLLVNVLSGEELDPSMDGDTVLKDPESGSKLRTFLSRKTKSKYQKNMEKHAESISDSAEKQGANYLRVSTEDDIFETFVEVWRRVNR